VLGIVSAFALRATADRSAFALRGMADKPLHASDGRVYFPEPYFQAPSGNRPW
jgi:hypothetical protein